MIHQTPRIRAEPKQTGLTMFIDSLLLQVQTIAAENPEGFTIDLRNLEMVKTGIAVGYAATQNQFGNGGLHKVLNHSLHNSGYIGGWKNPDGEMQYDSVRIFTDLRKAVKWGRKQKQYAIYDLDNNWEVVL